MDWVCLVGHLKKRYSDGLHINIYSTKHPTSDDNERKYPAGQTCGVSRHTK